MTVGVVCSMITTTSYAAGNIGGYPANPDPNNDRTKSIFVHTIKGGESQDDAVVVTNNTEATKTIDIYATDGVVTNTGALTCEQRVDTADKAGAWIRLSKSQVTLESGQKETVPFQIVTPSNADVGEHNACIVFQSHEDEGEVTGNVRIRTRSATRVAMTVPGDLRRELSITAFTYGMIDGKNTAQLKVKNSGNVSVDTKFSVRIDNLFGINWYRNEGQYPILAQTDYIANYSNDQESFWGGWYRASATIHYSKDTSIAVLSDNETGDSVTKIAPSFIVFVKPHPVAVFLYLIGILLLIGAVVLYIIRRRRLKDERVHSILYKVKRNDTVQGLADSHGVSWKHIVRVNNIEPPYQLEVGQELRIPTKGGAKESKEKE